MNKCYCCDAFFNKTEEHNLHYDKNITITVCKQCHTDIHRTDKWPELKPMDKSNYGDNIITLKGDRKKWMKFAIQLKREKKTVWSVLEPKITKYINNQKIKK